MSERQGEGEGSDGQREAGTGEPGHPPEPAFQSGRFLAQRCDGECVLFGQQLD
ncbi:hypothetical protein JK151_11275 [Ralstonia syzygii subsp. celebesensis]|nr:hypothetical protein JK151_11275 [Ralstonia syzygii subsp. celebesensis]